MASDLQRYDPFRQAMSLRDAMDRLMRESFVNPGTMLATGGETGLPLDVVEDENNYTVYASLPGIKPEDVHIDVQGDTLGIRGEAVANKEDNEGKRYLLQERQPMTYARALTLPGPIDADRATAHFEHGVLTLTLPKAAAAKPKTITVAGGSARA